MTATQDAVDAVQAKYPDTLAASIQLVIEAIPTDVLQRLHDERIMAEETVLGDGLRSMTLRDRLVRFMVGDPREATS